jgi:uncharacterized protein YkwD
MAARGMRIASGWLLDEAASHPAPPARRYAGPMPKRLRLLALILAAGAAQGAHADELFDAVAQARQRCGASTPLRPNARLDEAARRLAQGQALQAALQSAGYRARRSYQWSFNGHRTPQAAAQALVPSQCRALADPELGEAGVYRSGTVYRIIAAVPFDPPAAAQATDVAAKVLALVNQARSQPRRCGAQAFQPARPLVLNAQLTRAAAVHAQDMARRGYLEHQGRDGSSPADRASRAGYRWRSIGENIASGQTTPERVVQDWLRSPEHCANLMEPRFTEMGLAYAVNAGSEGGIYWAQTFGRR